jgi:hypothetical protein
MMQIHFTLYRESVGDPGRKHRHYDEDAITTLISAFPKGYSPRCVSYTDHVALIAIMQCRYVDLSN